MKKIKEKKGFTLVEMLACVLTLLLVCLICATGMGMTIKSYHRSLFESDSQMLESTLNMLVGDMLRYATNIKTEDEAPDPARPEEKEVTAFSSEAYQINEGMITVLKVEEENGGRFLACKAPGGELSPIIGENVYARSLYVDDFTLTYHAATGVFTGSYTIKSTIIDDAVRECGFVYRTIAAQ